MTIKKPLVINQPQVGEFIHDLRRALGLTQEQFAVALGVTYGTINRWEKGRSKPSPLAMKKIEEILQEIGQKGTDLLSQYFSEH
ncbi:helix-turn-helix domain-containing protein [Nostoc sp. CHAB 5836]|uniref:helix-turn-helix domain-containing protein n=1 Tax=Nostoc sp. CHAB 5836 TaxID=2780404 RepID=UPI001E6466C6|nr:helix-turn-helix transcriptional regulator [Nostoc sp. CHAB 5836]MCC5618526.1 helix-turn-helix domain-containing protein [Nostoc sp. CHAB 5836]